MIALFILFMADFAFTFYGVSEHIIEEANPLWVAVFNMPLIWGTLIRIGYFAIIIGLPCYLVYRLKPKAFPWLMRLGYVAYSLMILLHFRWLYLHFIA